MSIHTDKDTPQYSSHYRKLTASLWMGNQNFKKVICTVILLRTLYSMANDDTNFIYFESFVTNPTLGWYNLFWLITFRNDLFCS